MQSQCSQDSAFSGALCLSLSKFSYASVPEDSNAPIPWTHLSSKGSLFAVFEKCRSWDLQGQLHDQSRFRVTNNTEVMEDLNLIALAAEVRKAIGQNQVLDMLNRPSSVTIIVKKPCVAVRYPAGQGQIRRFQIRFLHDTDYYAALGRFSEANAPVTEAGTFPMPHPQHRPFSPSSSVLYPSDSAFHINAQPPSTPPLITSEKNTGTAKWSILPGADTSLRPVASGTSKMQGSNLTFPKPQTTSSDTCDQETRTHRPTSSSIFSGPLTGFSYSPINLYKPRPSTAPVIDSQRLSEMLPPKRDLPFPKPVPKSEAKSSKSKTLTSSLNTCGSQDLETQSEPIMTKSKEVAVKKGPPRVAKKPPQSRKKTASVRGKSPARTIEELLSRTPDSAEVVAILPKTIDTQALLARVEEQQNMINSTNSTSRPSAASSKVGEATLLQQNQSEASLPLALPTGSGQATCSSLDDESAPQTKVSVSVAKVDGLQEGYSNQSQARPSDQATLPDFSLAAPSPPPVRQAFLEQSLNTAKMSSKPLLQPLVRPLTDPLRSPPDFPGLPTLAEWAKAPEEERRASLETFICRSIQDENFFTLCKDLDGTWQRAFLGKML